MPRREREQALAPLLAISVLLTSLNACPSLQRSNEGETCGRLECLQSTSAAVLVGDSAASAAPACKGIVIRNDADSTTILTAAHCGNARRDDAKKLFVEVDCARSGVVEARRFDRHPRFRRRDAASGYDFAVLNIPRVACALPVEQSLEPVAVGANVLVPAGGTLQSLRVSRVTPLRLLLAGATDGPVARAVTSRADFEMACGFSSDMRRNRVDR